MSLLLYIYLLRPDKQMTGQKGYCLIGLIYRFPCLVICKSNSFFVRLPVSTKGFTFYEKRFDTVKIF